MDEKLGVAGTVAGGVAFRLILTFLFSANRIRIPPNRSHGISSFRKSEIQTPGPMSYCTAVGFSSFLVDAGSSSGGSIEGTQDADA